jgi:hypothetical protein
MKYGFAVLSLAAALVSTSAMADVITFDGVGPGVGSHAVPSPYQELNYSISAPNGLYYLGFGDPRYAGENNLFDNNYQDTTTLTTIDGRPFAIQSIDLAEMYLGARPATEPTTFTGTLVGGGTVTQTFDVSNASFQTYLFSGGFSGLTSLSWTATTETPQFANINVSTVPEPATWAMMLVGFGGLGAMLRSAKRKLADVVAVA